MVRWRQEETHIEKGRTRRERDRPLQDKDPETEWGEEGNRGWGRQKSKTK